MIPVVDLRQDDAVEALRRACEELGFFTVTGHGIGDELVAEVSTRSRAFFDLPDEEKRRFVEPAETPGVPVYRPLRSERLGATGDGIATADLKESLDWGPQLDGVAWPAGLEEPYRRYLGAMHGLARELRRVIARALGHDGEWFEDRFDEQTSSLRVINYPDPDPPPADGQLRAGAHRDYGFLTILRSDDAPGGLEVQTLPGEWIPVRPSKGAYVCNIGDLLADWTGWTSTLHRVAVPPPDEAAGSRRQSLVFFHNPADEASRDYILRKAAAALGSAR
ncbi:MAG: isopenicillin N synthase family dioxygenase [Gaiellaceae bacterium]